MNVIDKVVGFFSPVSAVRRAHARYTLENVRAYEAGKVGRRTGGWLAPSSSANVEVTQALDRVRNRSRDMVRNNEYASRAIDTLVSSTIGTGIKVKIGKYQDLYNLWAGECDADQQLDICGIQALAARTKFESGEVLLRRRYRPMSDNLVLPLQIQLLEPDYLVNKFEVLGSGNIIIAGIEFDKIGRRVAYHMYRSHPGEALGYVRNGIEIVRVPASEIIHLYTKKRPQQVRGMPQLATSMMRLRDMSDYEDAELVRKKIEACFSVFVRTDDSHRQIGEADRAKDKQIEKLAPGMIHYLKNAEEVTFANPQSNSAYGDYTRTQLRAIAVGSGVTYEQLTGDLSQVNFSSMRAGRIEFNSLIEQEQWLTFIPMLMRPLLRWFAEAAEVAGYQGALREVVKYTTPSRPYVDPTKEVAATKELIGSALMSYSEALRERGYDPDEVWDEIAEDAERMAKLGITPEVAVSTKLQDLIKDPPLIAKD